MPFLRASFVHLLQKPISLLGPCGRMHCELHVYYLPSAQFEAAPLCMRQGVHSTYPGVWRLAVRTHLCGFVLVCDGDLICTVFGGPCFVFVSDVFMAIRLLKPFNVQLMVTMVDALARRRVRDVRRTIIMFFMYDNCGRGNCCNHSLILRWGE